jgi:thiol-disulfide isomerase/thioredoxin
MKDWKILLLGCVVASLSAYAGFRLSSTGAPAGAAADTSDPAQLPVTTSSKNEIRIEDLAGREHSLSEWTGKILVVNFWATWCPPCVVEIPAFVQLQSELGARGLQFVGIALDDPVAAGKFATSRAMNYPVLAGDDNVARLMQSLGNTISALPYTVVFDRAGRIVHTQQGEWQMEDARGVIEPLLEPVSSNRQVAR